MQQVTYNCGLTIEIPATIYITDNNDNNIFTQHQADTIDPSKTLKKYIYQRKSKISKMGKTAKKLIMERHTQFLLVREKLLNEGDYY